MSCLRNNVWKNSKGRTAICKRNHLEKAVAPDLAYTPADMARMYAHGMPVNSTNLVGQFNDGSENVEWHDLTIDRRRGVDPAEIWEASKQSKQKLGKMFKSAKSKSNE